MLGPQIEGPQEAAPGPACWGCGRTEGALQLCTLCREEATEPCAFCSRECFESAWPRHSTWHKEQRRLFALAEARAAPHWTAAAAARVDSLSPMDALLGAVSNLGVANADQQLGAPESTDDVDLACRTFLQAVDRGDPTNSHGPTVPVWADRVLTAFALLSSVSSLPRPAWWNDQHLRALSERTLAARPDCVSAWRFRGEVLSACLGEASWPAPRRSSAELAEAGRCLQRAAELGKEAVSDGQMGAIDRERVVKQAVGCLTAAREMALHEAIDVGQHAG